MQTRNLSTLAGLTSIRFFAAMYVLLFHIRGGKWFGRGNTGVTLFFVLSGFILAYNHSSVPSGERMRFYIARFARIYPLYLFAFLIAIPFFLKAIGGGHTAFFVQSGIAFIFLVHTWYPAYRWVYNASAWTLTVEFLFYLVFPFAVAWIARLLGASQKHWKLLLAAFYIALLLPSAFADLVWMRHTPTAEAHIHHIFSLPPFHLCEFFIGIVLGLRFLHHRPVFTGRHVALATAFLVACIAASTVLNTNHYDEFFVNGVFAIPYGLLIYAIAGWNSRAFAHPFLQIGGEISFSLYLLQGTLIEIIQHFFHHTHRFATLRLGLLLGACFLTYRFIEKPSRSFILRRFGIRSHPKPIETTVPVP